MSIDKLASATTKGRVFPVPMWLLALLLLLGEFVLYAVWVTSTFARHDQYVSAAAILVALALVVRLLVAFASYVLSRWKGIELHSAHRMDLVTWVNFFFVEYWHLCMQNMLLIPLRALFRTHSERGHGPSTGPVLLLQHGYVNNGAVWFFTARALENQGFRVFTIDQPPFASIDTMADRLEAHVNKVLALTGATQLTLVAHSMGGLIARAYLRRFGGLKIAQLVTMGSPHHGTWHANLASGPNGLQMRPGNAWLDTLGQTPVSVPFTSIYSVHDTIISPQDSSIMPGANNIVLSGVGHVSMPSGRTARQALIDALR